MIWYSDGYSDVFCNVPEHITHLFGLLLNPMRGNTEEVRLICVSDYRNEIEELLKAESVEGYGDPGASSFGLGPTTWCKVYRQGGPLEWFNPPGGVHDQTGIIELRRDGWRRVA